MAHLWSAGRHYSVISIVRYPNISLRYCEATYSEQLAKSRTSFPPFSLLLFFILLLWQENCCWTSLLSSPPVIVSRESKTPITLLLNVASMWRLHVHTHTLSCPCLPCVSGLSTPVSRSMWWPLNHRLDTNSRSTCDTLSSTHTSAAQDICVTAAMFCPSGHSPVVGNLEHSGLDCTRS